MRTKLFLSTALIAIIIVAVGFSFSDQGSNTDKSCNSINVVLSGTGSDNSTVTATNTSTWQVYNLPHTTVPDTYSACYLPTGVYYEIKACYTSTYHGGTLYYYEGGSPVVNINMLKGMCNPD